MKRFSAVAILLALLLLPTHAQIIQPQQKMIISITPFSSGEGYNLNCKVKNLTGASDTFYLTLTLSDDCANVSQPLVDYEFTLANNGSINIVTPFPLSDEACAEHLFLDADVNYFISSVITAYESKSTDYCITQACGN